MGKYVRLGTFTTVKAPLVTGIVGAGGEGKSEAKTLSEEKGKGVPFSSYLKNHR